MEKMIDIAIKIFLALIVIPLTITIGPFLLIYLLCIFIWNLYLKLRVELEWPRNRFILFMYSDSENWSAYIKENVIPIISEHAVIINRTKQQNWKKEYSLEHKALEAFAGHGTNPVALIFRHGVRVHSIEFFETFRDLKSGKETTIKRKCQELFEYVPNHS